jgi:hypothetical protein
MQTEGFFGIWHRHGSWGTTTCSLVVEDLHFMIADSVMDSSTELLRKLGEALGVDIPNMMTLKVS